MERKKFELGRHWALPRPERLNADAEKTHYPGDFEGEPPRDAPELKGEARKVITGAPIETERETE